MQEACKKDGMYSTFSSRSLELLTQKLLPLLF